MKRIDVDKEIIEEIDEEEKKVSRKKTIILILKIVIPIIIIGILSFVTLRYIGNYGIVVKETAIYNNKINDDLNGLKIVHFDSLLYSENLDKKEIDRLIGKINYTNPDIIIYTGDLIYKDKITHKDNEYLISKLSSLKANVGKFAIKGELDKAEFDEIMVNSGFTIIDDNTLERIYIKNSYINLYNMNRNVKKEMIDDEIFNIILTHHPDNIDTILNMYSPELLLAGHTLNGQVRLPIIGGLFRNSVYMDPYYKKGNTDIYISGGIGNRDLNIRLLNNPSINFFRIRKEQ